MREVSRRQVVAAGLGIAGAGLAGGATAAAFQLLYREDLIPGDPIDVRLQPDAWRTTTDDLTFVALGDSGSGGRQAVEVASRMAATYEEEPFGLIAHLGDICYYGSIRDRFEEVFLRPMGSFVDAGVEIELAVGNHDGGIFFSDESLAEIETTLELLGTPDRYYVSTHGPADFFYLDSSAPSLLGAGALEQLSWFENALASSTARWKIVAMHHPIYSSGLHGSSLARRELLEPIFVRHGVDLVFAGHDHHYERTLPIDGVTYVVTGGGCKTTPVDPQEFTAFAESTLEFVLVRIDGDRLVSRAIRPDGDIVDRFELGATDAR